MTFDGKLKKRMCDAAYIVPNEINHIIAESHIEKVINDAKKSFLIAIHRGTTDKEQLYFIYDWYIKYFGDSDE